jgi:hypothetical protein
MERAILAFANFAHKRNQVSGPNNEMSVALVTSQGT